jgi:uncharacterized protein YndB with AHSA1/START domain
MALRKAAAAIPDRRELVVERVLDAPRRLVFKCWTDPRRAMLWWGPRGFTNLVCEMDVRPGGAWRRVMRGADGTLCCKRGVYVEIVEPERLVLTYADDGPDGRPGHETLVTVAFADEAGKTRLRLHQARFAEAEARDGHLGGWTSCLERFADYLASGGWND